MEPESRASDLDRWKAFLSEFNIAFVEDEQDTTDLRIITQRETGGGVVMCSFDIQVQFNATDGKFIEVALDKE